MQDRSVPRGRAFPPDGPREFTDEAGLLEAARIPVHAIPGEPTNIKVTVPADLERAAEHLGASAAPSAAAPSSGPAAVLAAGCASASATTATRSGRASPWPWAA